MTISKIADRGSTTNTAASTTTAVDMAAAGSVKLGNYLIARVALDNTGASGAATTLSVSDPRSNTWTVISPAANQDPGAAAAGATCYIAYARVTTLLVNGDDATFTYGASTTADSIVIEEWAGIHTTPLAVAHTTANGASGTPSIARTPTAAGQLFYGAIAAEGPTGDSYTEDSDTTDGSWVSLTKIGGNSGTATNDMTVTGAYKIVTGTSAQTWNPTITSRDWAQAAMVFDAAPAMSTHVDNFDDNSVNATLWPSNYGTAVESSGRAVITCSAAGSGYVGRAIYVFDTVTARVLPAAPLNETVFSYTALIAYSNGQATSTDAAIIADTFAGTILFTTRTAGASDAGSASISYDSVAHAWWRIRHSGANVIFDTSPDGSTWTQRNSQTGPVAWVDANDFLVAMQTGRGDGTNNTTEIDNINVGPTALIPADTRRLALRPLLVR